MSLRNWMNENPAAMTGVAVVLVAICGLFILRQLGGGGGGGPAIPVYFYDLNTGKVFLAENTSDAPIDAPSGPTESGNAAGVEAHIYSCSTCPSNMEDKTAEEVEAAGAFIFKIQMYSPEIKKRLEAGRKIKRGSNTPQNIKYGVMEGRPGLFLKTVKGKEWVDHTTAKGQKINEKLPKKCPGQPIPNRCNPDRS